MFAALAQLVERRLGKAEVGSSNLLGSLNHEAFRNIREAFFRVTGNLVSCRIRKNTGKTATDQVGRLDLGTDGWNECMAHIKSR